MNNLSQQRCLNHTGREAAARCPTCRQYYCRECVTEHEDRLICAACLRKSLLRPARRRFQWAGLLRIVQCCIGLMIAWLFFYGMGQVLLSVPSSFHEGTIWESGWATE